MASRVEVKAEVLGCGVERPSRREALARASRSRIWQASWVDCLTCWRLTALLLYKLVKLWANVTGSSTVASEKVLRSPAATLACASADGLVASTLSGSASIDTVKASDSVRLMMVSTFS